MIPANAYSIQPLLATNIGVDHRIHVIPAGVPQADVAGAAASRMRRALATVRTELVAMCSLLQVRPSVSHGKREPMRSRFVPVRYMYTASTGIAISMSDTE